MKYAVATLAFMIAINANGAVWAEEDAAATEAQKPAYADNLLGDWGGVRTTLADQGIDTTVEYKGDIWGVTSGGAKRGSNYNDNLDVKFALDNEKLFGLKGNKALIYFLNNFGGHANGTQVGSVQGIDNIETGSDTAKLYEAWDEQKLFDDKVSVLVGLHDLNTEFMVTDVTANFIKPTFQVNQELAQSGTNGPSVFPTTSLAGRVKYMPTDESYVMAAAFDGVPGEPSDPHGTHIDFGRKDGLLLISEAGLTPKADDAADSTPNKLALGAWMYTTKFDDLEDVDINGNPVKRRSEGLYLLAAYQFFHDKEAGHDIGAFFRGGFGDGDTKQTDWFYTAGLVGNGWVPTRSDSELGFGLTQSHNAAKYVKSVVALGNRADSSEYGFEAYYRDKLYRGISVQPDFQYIVNPGTDPTLKDATIVGIRFDMSL